MVITPKIQLAQLREIGWSEWDPISLQEIDPDWRSDGGEDEYDSYMLHVAGLILSGKAAVIAKSRKADVQSARTGQGCSR